jgi:hypothetical protein
VWTAAGPYSLDENLAFDPFFDLMAAVDRDRPDVLILVRCSCKRYRSCICISSCACVESERHRRSLGRSQAGCAVCADNAECLSVSVGPPRWAPLSTRTIPCSRAATWTPLQTSSSGACARARVCAPDPDPTRASYHVGQWTEHRDGGGRWPGPCPAHILRRGWRGRWRAKCWSFRPSAMLIIPSAPCRSRRSRSRALPAYAGPLGPAAAVAPRPIPACSYSLTCMKAYDTHSMSLCVSIGAPSPPLSLSPSLSFSPLPWMHVAVGGQHVVAYPNPATFSVNEVTLGVCTADPLFALAAEEAARVPPPPEDGTAAGPDRLSRLAEHIIQQQLCVHSVHSQTETQTHLQRDRHTRTGSAPTHARAHPWTQRAWLGHSAGQLTDCVMVGCAGLRYYPLHPPALGTAIDLTRMSALELPITPDILLLPSDLKPFVKARARTHRGIRLHAQRHEDMHVYTNTYTHARPNTYTHTRALACTHKATSTQGHTHDYRGRSRKTRPSLPLTGVQQKSGVRMLVMLLLCVYTCLPTIMPVDPC